eukprot:319160-Pyramimonas_sp.AAC.1
MERQVEELNAAVAARVCAEELDEVGRAERKRPRKAAVEKNGPSPLFSLFRFSSVGGRSMDRVLRRTGFRERFSVRATLKVKRAKPRMDRVSVQVEARFRNRGSRFLERSRA